MLPFLHLGPLNIPTFGIMLWVAAVSAGLLLDRNFRRNRITADAVGMVAITVVVGIVGAKVWHVLDTPSDFQAEGWRVLWDSAGFAWFGGLVFGISALILQGLRARIGALRMLDFAAPSAALGYGIGRIGCFLSGDGCYGKATTLPWGMSFPHGTVPIYTPVHPTPLYELAGGVLIAIWLWRRGGKPHATGNILGQYLVLTGLARFLVEFLRRNPHVQWGMSNAQLASIGSMVAGTLLLVWLAVRRRADVEAPSGQPVVAR